MKNHTQADVDHEHERTHPRRINPQRLASRLDPELVAELDALIVPGATMPSFAIRKTLQDRYCVDRREIYDYFHSRGLRLAKKDRHTNLKCHRSHQSERILRKQLSGQPISQVPNDNLQDSGPYNTFSLRAAGIPCSKRMPKRAATFPGIEPQKHIECSPYLSEELWSEKQLPACTSSSSVTSSSVSWSVYPEAGNNDSANAYREPEKYEAAQIISCDTASSALDDTNEDFSEDFLAPFGTSWALDLCSSLYDFEFGSSFQSEPDLLESRQSSCSTLRSDYDFFEVETQMDGWKDKN